MKRNLLFTLLLAGFIGVFFIACDNSGGPIDDPDDPAVSISDSSWSDAINPETTLSFSANQVTLGGEPSAETGDKNWYWGVLDGKSYPYNIVENAAEIEDLLDKVEDNWGSAYTVWPDAVIVVWTDPLKNIGFQLHYYAKGSGKNYERLICWIDPTHEFKRN
ncbi:MAG: hypothetical protein LBD58_01670 [Treponema sp.]|jgi:hypothetical protein|nr:hypothetical protein [Treponema sp.]